MRNSHIIYNKCFITSAAGNPPKAYCILTITPMVAATEHATKDRYTLTKCSK